MPILMSDGFTNYMANQMVTALALSVDTGSTLNFFDGILPSGPSDPDDGTLLCSIDLDSSSWVYDSANQFHWESIAEGTVIADGSLSYWRLKQSSDVVLMQGDCGISGLNDIVFDNADVLIDDVVNVTSFVVVLGIGGE